MRYQFLAAAALLLSAGYSLAETVDNPEFANWKKFPKGTTVTLKITSKMGEMTSETSLTHKLIEVGDDKVVLESSAVIKSMGRETKAPTRKREVPRKTELPKGAKKGDCTRGTPPGTTEEGTETIKVAGKSLKTKWYKYKIEMGGVKADSKMWSSDEVPGMIVKMDASSSGAVSSTMKVELVEFKKP